jgi:hypothetical protein
VKVLSYPILSDIRKIIPLPEGSNALPVCPSAKGNKLMKIRVVHWWNGTERGKPKLKFKTNLNCM